MGRWFNLDPDADNYYEWSPYNYVGSNPLIRSDPDGKNWIDRIAGAVVGIATNIVPGSTSLRNTYTPTDASHYNNTLRAVDNTATLIGGSAIIGGGTAAAAGETAIAAGAVLTASIVGAEAGIPIAAGGAAVTQAGLAVAAGGVVLSANAIANKNAGYEYGGGSDTKSQSEREAFRKAKDQNGVPRSQQPDKTTTVREKGTGKPLKQSEFTNSKGEKVQIRRDNPKKYGDGGEGDQGKHFNAGAKDQKLKQHHDYE